MAMSKQPVDAETNAKNRYVNAPRNADGTIDFDWNDYSDAEHDRWNRLAARCRETLETRACRAYLDALDRLGLSGNGIPNMADLSARIEPLTGWRIVPVSGYVDEKTFFELLAQKKFPAGAFIRPESEFDYLEEPDNFHDIFGHAPLLTNPAYAEFSHRYGLARTKASRHGCLTELLNLYWFTIEFGLIREDGGLKLFGAGLMSSAAEARFALESAAPNRIGFDLERCMRTEAFIDDYQQTYFVIDSFEALLEACEQDFEPIYRRLADGVRHAPHAVLETDEVLHRGDRSHALARAKALESVA